MIFREARRADVPAILDLLRDDHLGAERETAPLEVYLAAFDEMAADPSNKIIVLESGGRLVGTYQLTLITGLSHRGTRRAQIESVRVAADLRGGGLGRQMMADAASRAKAAGADLLQLTTHSGRERAHAFYRAFGFEPSHLGFKRRLD